MIMKRLTSATVKENVRRQVERKRRFEMSMPQGGTDELERAFETSPYVRAVYTAFKEGDDDDAVYAMQGILLLALQFRNGTRCGEFQNITVSTHLHTHAHTHRFYRFCILFRFSLRRLDSLKRCRRSPQGTWRWFWRITKQRGGTRQPSTWPAILTGILGFVKRCLIVYMYLNVYITIKKVSIRQLITFFQCYRNLREYCLRTEGQWCEATPDDRKFVFHTGPTSKIAKTEPVPHTYINRWQKEAWKRCLF